MPISVTQKVHTKVSHGHQERGHVEKEKGGTRTGVIFDAVALDAIRHIGEARQAGDEPAVAQVALLDVAGKNILHEHGLVVDFVYALHGFGDVGRRVDEAGVADVELGRAEAVEAVALFPLEVPVLSYTHKSDQLSHLITKVRLCHTIQWGKKQQQKNVPNPTLDHDTSC